MTTAHRKSGLFALAGLATLVASGCHTDMWRQPREEPLGLSSFYADGASSRPLSPGTIPRNHLRTDEAFFTGQSKGQWLDKLPTGLSRQLLDRGQERFDIFCSPCHGRTGNGQGMIAQRGFSLKRPVGNFHTDRLRQMPVGYYYDVITNGFGTMYGYASRIEPQDRWAIAAYIRVLQASQNQPASVVPSDRRAELEKTPVASPGAMPEGQKPGMTRREPPQFGLEGAAH